MTNATNATDRPDATKSQDRPIASHITAHRGETDPMGASTTQFSQ